MFVALRPPSRAVRPARPFHPSALALISLQSSPKQVEMIVGQTRLGIVIKNIFVPGQFIVLGIHTYKRRGTFNISTLITNTVEGTTATATAHITV